MFSGGIDSTYVAYNHMKNNPDETLLLYHINLYNKENRANCEKSSINKILNYFQNNNLTNYLYLESTFDYGDINWLIYDIEIAAFFIFVLLKNPQYSTINNILLPFYMNKSKDRYQSFNRILDMSNKNLHLIYPIKHMCKKQVIESLPKELYDLTWYCRTPKNNKPCGLCITCIEVHNANASYTVTENNILAMEP